ncbi:CD151 antigen-like [Haliotis rufescens]|uniref:CD151 antigen-like n=1 Tax=Haliotis rufescens TaxID=6454 RepID=UPI001EB05BAB|nr:CD151 antigen-like [Haliotis rufescens]XP_046327084.1 CD151 antigen-like [Haliotis rufescens]XP_046327085.1 CD151 antigen-like [Haliotis rufescens]XP_046327087.1 CD151 antigen-like [Haliotis rufescens]
MAEGGCATCSRYMLIIFNFIFWISGGAILGTGIFVLVSDEVDKFLKSIDIGLPVGFLYTAAYIMIAVGAFVFFVGFCGCCGAVRESAFMLGIYIFCMAVVMCGELGAGIYVAVEKGYLESEGHGVLIDTVKNYTGAGNSTIDFLQIEFNCCGADNYTDYRNSEWVLNQMPPKRYVPDTCCRGKGKDVKSHRPANATICREEAEPGSPIQPEDRTQLQQRGCFPAIRDWIGGQSIILICVGIGIALIQVLGIIFAVCLCRNRSEYYE